MHRLVRDLYKRFLFAGKDYPKGLDYVRNRVKKEFFANAHLTTEAEIQKAVAKGRWWVKEVEGVNQLRKYRTLKSRYYPEPKEAGDGSEIGH